MAIFLHFGYTFVIIGSVVLGASILWGHYGGDPERVRLHIPLFEIMPGTKAGHLLKFGVFLAVGTLVAIIVARPDDPAQGLSAGAGWTALLTRRPPIMSTPRKGDKLP